MERQTGRIPLGRRATHGAIVPGGTERIGVSGVGGMGTADPWAAPRGSSPKDRSRPPDTRPNHHHCGCPRATCRSGRHGCAAAGSAAAATTIDSKREYRILILDPRNRGQMVDIHRDASQGENAKNDQIPFRSRLTISEPLCPPKPKLFDMATVESAAAGPDWACNPDRRPDRACS